MSSHILLVFEGRKTEPHLFDSLLRYFKPRNSVLVACFNASIPQLEKEIKKGRDILPLMQERDIENINLQNITREDISEITCFLTLMRIRTNTKAETKSSMRLLRRCSPLLMTPLTMANYGLVI
jgi:hypothetical protein